MQQSIGNKKSVSLRQQRDVPDKKTFRIILAQYKGEMQCLNYMN